MTAKCNMCGFTAPWGDRVCLEIWKAHMAEHNVYPDAKLMAEYRQRVKENADG